MVIDKYMPVYDVAKNYSLAISAPVEKVFSALKNSYINDSPLIRLLFFLRGLPKIFRSRTGAAGKRLTISDIAGTGFILLHENQNEELVIGVIGQFWKLTGNIKKITAEEFIPFNTTGYAKAVWNFSLQVQSNGSTILTTETRVQVTDETSRRRFMRYWSLIGPFSGLIRKEMLRIVKREAEH